jgi:hypothetical protein
MISSCLSPLRPSPTWLSSSSASCMLLAVHSYFLSAAPGPFSRAGGEYSPFSIKSELHDTATKEPS